MNSFHEKEKKLNNALNKLKNLELSNPGMQNNVESLSTQKNQLEIEKSELEDKYKLLLEEHENLRLISLLENVSGRFEYIISNEKKITTIVDYAHTPDALKNVLETINNIRTGKEQLITVVGCGGDRDKSKRPKMANIASVLSTTAVFTSDNPRTENPDTIIEEMESGVTPENYKKTIAITNRKQAIKTACQMAEANDIILIAGKGHETYQEVNGVRSDFDDLKIVKELLTQLNK